MADRPRVAAYPLMKGPPHGAAPFCREGTGGLCPWRARSTFSDAPVQGTERVFQALVPKEDLSCV